MYVDIQRDANSKNCNGNWNNVGVEVDGTAYPPYWAALCYHDGTTNCSQGYHANQNGNNYINSGNPGTHTVVLTLNNGACQCNGGSFTTIGTITNTPTPTIAPTLTPTLTPTSTPTMTPIPTPTPNPTGDIWWQTELGDVWADNGSLQSNISGKCNPSSQVCDISRAKDSGLSSPNDRINGVLVAAAGQISPGDNHLAGYGERFDWFAESNNGPYFLNDENGDSWPGYDYWQEKLANLTPTDYDDFSNTIDLGAISTPGLYFFTDVGHETNIDLTVKGSVESGEQVIILNKNNTVLLDTYPVEVAPGGFLMVVAHQEIKIETCDPDRENRIDGILVSDGVIKLGGGSNCSPKLQVNGSVLGLGGVALNRSNLAEDPDNAEPYISVYYRPDMVYSAPEEIKTGTVRWQEVNPQFTY